MNTTTASHRPAALAEQLAPYLPRWLRARLPLPPGYEETTPATLLYADIQAFTTLVQALTAVPDGAEQLNDALARIFTPLITVIHAHGGDIIKFAGDSLTVLFPDRITAACAAEAMRNALPVDQPTPSGEHRLALRMGIGEGPLTWQIVGTPELGMYWVAHGPALAQALAGSSGPGWTPSGAAFPAPPDCRPPAQTPWARAGVLEPYLPAALVARLREGLGGWIGEFRAMCPAFVMLPDAGDLQALVAQALPLVTQFGGRLSEVEVGDKGRLLVLWFGAPVAYGDDVAHAADCLLALRAAGVLVRAGLTLGTQYVGTVGAPAAERCTYSAAGNEMNLAARLMQAAAPGQILVSGPVRRVLDTRFRWLPGEPLAVKGWAAPVPVAVLDRRAPASRASAPTVLLGREAEMAQAQAALSAAAPGQAALIRLVGDPGIGKSLLAVALGREATAAGWRVLASVTHPDQQHTPYAAWLDLLRALLGRDPAARTAEASVAPVARLVPDRVSDTALLSDVLNGALPAARAAWDAPARAGATRTLLAALIAAISQDDPLLLLFDDLQWADPFSWELIATLAQGDPAPRGRLAMVLTHRRLTLPAPIIDALPVHLTLMLRELPPEAAAALVRAQQTLPNSVVDQIVERGQGHPFFLQELAKAYANGGLRTVPDTVQDLVQARIDRLPEPPKLALKLASVLGRRFAISALEGSYPPDVDPGALPGHLESLSNLDLLRAEDNQAAGYAFTHAITQEVAYGNLLGTQRRAAHERAGAWFEQTDPHNYPLLVYHYARSDNLEKQQTYLRAAGAAARAAYANTAAIDYYQRLLPLLAPTERIEVLLDLAEIHLLIEDRSAAEAYCVEALTAAETGGETPPARLARARAQQTMGQIVRNQGSFAEAVEWMERARAGFAAAGDLQRLRQTVGWIGRLYWLQDDYQKAQLCFEEELQLAMDLSDQRAIGQAVGNLGNIYDYLGEYLRASFCLERALEVARELDDRMEQERAYWSLGSMYDHQHDYPRALAAYAETWRIAEEIGDRRAASIALSGMALTYLNHGEDARALSALTRYVAEAVALGDRNALAVSLGNLALLYSRQERYLEAAPLFGRAIALARTLDTSAYLYTFLYYAAEYYTRQGLYAVAARLNGEAARLVAEGNSREFALKTTLLDVYLRQVEGITDRASAIAEVTALRAAWPAAEEQAAILFTLWQLDPTQDPVREAAATAYAALYATQPYIEYRQRHEALTGDTLPAAPPLPDLPAAVTAEPCDLSALLRRAGVALPPAPPAIS